MDSFYTVNQNDTLPGIAQRFYNDATKFPIIAQANGIADPDRIFPGQLLRLPDLTPADLGPPPDPDQPPDPIDFRLLRTLDLLDLQCIAIGCRAVTDGAAPTEPLAKHTVKGGDNLWNLARFYYGDGRLYRLIAEANHIPNPSRIFPGQVLIIPRRPGPPPPPPAGTRLIAVTDTAHLVVTFGPQNIYEETTFDNPARPPTPPAIARSRAANVSRVVFELPKCTEIPFSVSGVLRTLTTLGLRVPALAVPKLQNGQQRPPEANVKPAAPRSDQTAIEAPYRLIVSPDKHGGFTHMAEATTAPDDSNLVELWHSRLGVRRIVDGKFVGVDEADDVRRTVRPVWTRDDDPQSDDIDFGSLTTADRRGIVRQSGDPTPLSGGRVVEPEPLSVEKLYVSALGAWIDWRVAWPRFAEYPGDKLSAYRHLAPMGRDSYVRVETPVYLFPFGHRGTLIKITERRIKALDGDQAANLFQRNFIVLRERTRTFEDKAPFRFPFKAVTIDPLVSPDLDRVVDRTKVFVPSVAGNHYQWKITAVDWADREITMTTALVAVPPPDHPHALDTWNKEIANRKSIVVSGAEVAFATPKVPGDTTARVEFLDLTGDAAEFTSTPWMVKAHIAIPAVAAVNRIGARVAVTYKDTYVSGGFNNDDPAQIFLVLDQESRLDFAGASDRGGGFVEPSVAINALSRTQGAVGDKGDAAGGIKDGKFDPALFLGKAVPKLFGLFQLKEILKAAELTEAPKLIADQLDFIGSVAADYAGLIQALEKTRDRLALDIPNTDTAGAKKRLTDLKAATEQALAGLMAKPVQPLIDALRLGPPTDATDPAKNPAGSEAKIIISALDPVGTLATNPFLPAHLRALVERPYQALRKALEAAQKAEDLTKALQSPLDSTTVRYDWNPLISAWPVPAVTTSEEEVAKNAVFYPGKSVAQALSIAVEIRVPREGDPQSDVSAQLRNFRLQLLPGEPLMAVRFSRVGFRVATGGKPEVDVQFDGLEFLGSLGFIDKLRRLIPFDGFADPPQVDISPAGATAGFELALPSVAVGVFTLENIAMRADCRVPFLGEAVTVGFAFCAKEAPFRLTVLALGGGGWVGIRLAPKGLVMLEMGLEAGASLSVDLGVASGSVSVMIGVYLRLEGNKGQIAGYFRIRGEVEVLGIASASITLELSLTYDCLSGKLVGRASLRVEIEVAFFSASVEITCERKLPGSKGDPTLAMIMPPNEGGQATWDQYFSYFAIGA